MSVKEFFVDVGYRMLLLMNSLMVFLLLPIENFTPTIVLQLITLPQTAVLAEVDKGNNIKTGDCKISSSTEPTATSTTQNNTAANIDIDNGYVDLRNKPEFNKIEGFADTRPTLKEVGTIKLNTGTALLIQYMNIRHQMENRSLNIFTILKAK